MTTTPVDQQLPSPLNEQFINYSVNSETQNMDKNETVNMDNNNQNTDLTSKAKNEEENLINFDASEEMKKSIEMIRPELTDSTSYTFLTKSIASINLADIENNVVNKPAFDNNNFQLLTSQQSPFNPKSTTCTDDIAEKHSSTLLTVDDVADLSKPQHVVVQKTLDNVSSTSNNFSPLFDPLSISNDPVDSKASSVDKQLLSAVEVSSSSVMKTETILDKSPELPGQISAISEVDYSESSEKSIGIAENGSTPDSTVQPIAPHTETVELPPVDHHLVKHFQNVEAEEVDQISLSKSDSAEIVFTPSTTITEPLKTTDNTTTEQQQPVEMKSTLAAKKTPDANSNKKKASAGIKPRCESATTTTPKVSSNYQNLKQTPRTTTTGKLASSSRPVSSKPSGRKTTTSSPLVSSTGTARTAPRTAAAVSSKTPPSKNLSKSTATTSSTFKSSSITTKSPATKSSSTAHKTDSKYMTNGALKSNSIEKKPMAKNDSTTTRKTIAPTSTTTAAATAAGSVKQIEARKLQWNVKAKVGSLENAQHKPTTTGRVQIYNQKLNFKNAKSKIGSMDNIKHKPAGGNVKIFEQKVDFKSKASPKYDIGITKKKEITVETSDDQAAAAAAAAAATQPMQQQQN
ncbi:Microtubule-associated protein 4 [Trichinella zimbabwensis]|uniref:Microtubule-associated protein n=1 Tax=Trichinella zimbabwensis TaxID=268475 RepID=A0A0V1HVK0_9BILA|nr:Microtubule-associated protein 4 [Trichinella zimbabwensis]